MPSDPKIKIIAIVGPTASGKSDLAVAIALTHNGEIVSADSRQVYQGLTIGSGKITTTEMQGIPHHLLDVADPLTQTYTASDFQTAARAAIADITSRGKLPILVGGTGFYIDAVLYELNFPHVEPNEILRKELEGLSTESLFAKLQAEDPERAATIDEHNRLRLIRALEIVAALGSVPPLEASTPVYNHLKIGLDIPTELLKSKMEKRLDSRLENGLIEEVQSLHKAGLSWERLEAFGLEYRFVSLYLQDKLERGAMRNQLLLATGQYSKRQMTWFKRDTTTTWISEPGAAEALVAEFLIH